MKWIFLLSALVCVALLTPNVDAGNTARGSVSRIMRKIIRTCDAKVDVIMLLDSSFSLNPTKFNQMKKFMYLIMKDLNSLSKKGFRAGIITFSTKAVEVLRLKEGILRRANFNAIWKKIRRLKLEKGMTHTGLALKVARKIGFLRSHGHRKGAQKVILLITDGNANGRISVSGQKKKLTQEHIQVISLGIGSKIDKSRLKALSGSDKTVMVKDFSALHEVSQKITGLICGKVKKKYIFGKVFGRGGKVHKKSLQQLMKQRCSLTCTKNQRLVILKNPAKPCLCIPKYKPRRKKRRRGKKALIVPKRCRTSCDDPKKIRAPNCRCVCKNKCPPNMDIDRRTCGCTCNVKCKISATLNRKLCVCRQNTCTPDKKLVGDKCVPKLLVCSRGRVMIDGICKKGFCPKGYAKARNRVCVKPFHLEKVNNVVYMHMKRKCAHGVLNKKGKCVPRCKRGVEFYYKTKGKNCHNIKAYKALCRARKYSYFNLLASGCERTCKKPTLIGPCRKKRRPRCQCYPGYLKRNGVCVHASQCKNKPNTKPEICIEAADIAILIDDTFSMGKKNYYLALQFTRDIIELMNFETQYLGLVSLCRPHVGVKYFINRDHPKQYWLRKLAARTYTGGLTQFGRALHFVRTSVFSLAKGARRGVPRILFILTDGSRDDGFIDEYHEARLLRQKGVRLVAFGLGKSKPADAKRLMKLVGSHGAYHLYGLNKYRDILLLLNRIISFKDCGVPVCPLPRLYVRPCIREYHIVARETFEHVKGQYRCKSVMNMNYRKIRCACPRNKKVILPCKKQFKVIKRIKYVIKKNVCQEIVFKKRVRCACPGPKVSKGLCTGQFMFQKIKSFIPFRRSNGQLGCRVNVTRKKVRCGCPRSLKKVEKCLHNYKIIHITRFLFKGGKCKARNLETEKRCACPAPTFTATKCRKGKIRFRGYFQFVREKSDGCRTDVWTKAVSCKPRCKKTLDLTIVIDSSKSVRLDNFKLIKEFLVKLVSKYKISRTNTRVTLLVFSSKGSIRLIFPFMAYFNRQHMIARIKDLKYRPGTTVTGGALHEFRTHFNRYTTGIRKTSAKVVLLITDGAANDKEHDSVVEAKKLRAFGFRIITVGIGIDIRKKMLKKLASEPFEKNVFITKFGNLMGLISSKKSPLLNLYCDVGKRNSYALMRKLKQFVLDKHAAHEKMNEAVLAKLGFEELPMHDLLRIRMRLRGDLNRMTSKNSPFSRKRLERALKAEIAKRLGIKGYLIHGFHMKSSHSTACKKGASGEGGGKKKKEKKKKEKKKKAKNEKKEKKKEEKKTPKQGKKVTKNKAKKASEGKAKSRPKRAAKKAEKAKKTEKADKAKKTEKAGKAKKTEKAGKAKKTEKGGKGKKSEKGGKGKVKVAKTNKCFTIGFLFKHKHMDKLRAMKHVELVGIRYKVLKVLVTRPDVRRVYRRACKLFGLISSVSRWYNRQLLRMNMRGNAKFIVETNKGLKSIKGDLEKAEKLQSKGKNQKSLTSLLNSMSSMLQLIDRLTKGPKKLRVIKVRYSKQLYVSLTNGLLNRLRRKDIEIRCKSTVKLLTKAIQQGAKKETEKKKSGAAKGGAAKGGAAKGGAAKGGAAKGGAAKGGAAKGGAAKGGAAKGGAAKGGAAKGGAAKGGAAKGGAAKGGAAKGGAAKGGAAKAGAAKGGAAKGGAGKTGGK